MLDLLKYWLSGIIICSISFLVAYSASGIIAGPETGKRGKIPSLRFRIKKYTIHFHHWLTSFLFSLFLIKYYAIFSITEFLILLGGSLGITAHGIKNYKDWKKIIIKE